MKYINKKQENSIKVAKKLHDWRDNYQHATGDNFEHLCKNKKLTAKEIWELLDATNQSFSKQELRTALHEEQKGICCYCGKEINLEDNLPIEHFLPKSKDTYNNTYTYDNLLLSCTGNKRMGKHYVKKGETWEEIAKLYDMEIRELKQKNSGKELEEKTTLTINTPPTHCDAHKGEKPDEIINPTQVQDCWQRLKYTSDGNIKHEKNDKTAENTIKVLNLNAKILQNQRKDAWKKFRDNLPKELSIVKKSQNISDDKQAAAKLLEAELKKDATYPFCVVKRSLLKSLVEKINHNI